MSSEPAEAAPSVDDRRKRSITRTYSAIADMPESARNTFNMMQSDDGPSNTNMTRSIRYKITYTIEDAVVFEDSD